MGDIVRHACFTDLRIDGGRVHHVLTSPTGPSVTLWAQEVFGWVQIFVTPHFPSAEPGELAIAIEPMTAPPNALRSGVGLRWLESGEEWTLTWGITLAA
ncbi:hypothetical protein DDP54_13665 [Cellulomonas sp. WB94]|uniref:hypothetical protein n=1 Tax=Cellulomonas sp. WB94 TaxID=2173174 RepID=UPI000D568C79|nr:hypothetical protein [Cellulomonas sp. WB94]PVU83863.1 hypothetical protein DDP54_13665 [Cellulomonas sp. WB94]